MSEGEGGQRKETSKLLRLGTFLGATPSLVTRSILWGLVWSLAGCAIGLNLCDGAPSCTVSENLDLGL